MIQYGTGALQVARSGPTSKVKSGPGSGQKLGGICNSDLTHTGTVPSIRVTSSAMY
jgi:hypothetical protein